METKKRVAVIGYGGMGGWHVKHLLESDVAEVAGICDIKEERRQLARENGLHVYETFEDVLADPTVDLLTLAVPNELHMPMAVQAMDSAGPNMEVTICRPCTPMSTSAPAPGSKNQEQSATRFWKYSGPPWDTLHFA